LKVEKDAFWSRTIETIGSNGVTLVLTLFTGMLLSRGLGPHDKGVYTAILTWSTILLWTFNLSLYQVTVFYFGRKPYERGTVFTTLMVASFCLGMLASCAGELLVVPVLRKHGFISASDIGLVHLLFATLPLSTMLQVVYGGLNGSMRFTFTNTVRMLQNLVLVIVWASLYLSHRMTLNSCLYWFIVVTNFFNISGLLYAVRVKLFGRKFSWSILRSGLSYGLKAHGSTTADQLSNTLAPVLLSVLLPAASIGYFSTAQSAAGTLNVFSTAIIMTGFPVLSSIHDDSLHPMTMRMWRATLFVTVPISILMASLFPFVIPLVFGKSFEGAINCAMILLVSVILSGQAGIIRNALNSRGYSLINSISEGIALIFCVAGIFVFPRWFGVEGVALANVVGSVARVAILIRSYVVHIHTIRVLELIPGRSEAHYCMSVVRALKSRIIQRA
jgi:O-antigen/teichoic acid export membrane protein